MAALTPILSPFSQGYLPSVSLCVRSLSVFLIVKGHLSEIELFVVRWMDLESVIQSEVSQKEK